MLTKKIQRKEDGKLIISSSPSPWNLKVKNSWIFPFSKKNKRTTRINKSEISTIITTNPLNNGNKEYEREDKDGLGMVMIISYSDSNAGPYDELLFAIPCNKPVISNELLPTYRIPVIYVSTEASVRNGRKNWGIRKELANFKWTHTNGFLHQITTLIVTDRLTDEILFDGSFVTLFLPPIPLPMSWLGKLCPIIAERKIDEEGVTIGNKWQLTRLGGFGWSRFCFTFVNSILGNLKLFFGVHLRGSLLFPVPKEIPVYS